MKNQIQKYVWKFPVNLPGGNFGVVTAEIPMCDTNTHERGMPKRKYWTSEKLFKREVNADKYLNKIYSDQRNHNLTQMMVNKGLINLN